MRCHDDGQDPLDPGRKPLTPYPVRFEYVLVGGVHDGVRNKIVLTGSGNCTGSAPHGDDESSPKADTTPRTTRYELVFDRAV